MNETPILGPGPHKLRLRATLGSYVGGLLMAAIGLAAFLGYGGWQAGAIITLLEESDVWEGGVAAHEGGIEGEVTTRQFIFDSYELQVEWLDASDRYQHSEQEFNTLFDGVEENEPVEVRYMPTDDGYAIATSWGESVRTSRWVAALFMLVIGFMIAGVFIWLGLAIVKKAWQNAQTVKDFDEVWLRVVNVVETSNNGVVTRIFTLLDDEKQNQFTEGITKHMPLTIGPNGAHLLGLRRPGSEFFLILRHDLYPLAKDASARADILDRVARPKA